MNKESDNLTLCSIAAQNAGMSYGQFMAMGGYAKVAKQAEESKQEGPHKICVGCGKRFPAASRRLGATYCSPECQQKAGAERALARYHANKTITKEVV